MKRALTIFIPLLLMMGCSTSGQGATKMNVSEFSNKIQEPGVVILDVRTPDEFAEGYIEGARLIDFQSGNFESEIAKLDKNITYAIYCRSGNRSGKAAEVMYKAGFQDVYNLDGGVIDWTSAGMTLVNN